MSLWRSTTGASARRGRIRTNVERLDERIVPDTTTGTVTNDTTSTTGNTSTGSSTTTTTTGTSSTSSTNTTQGTTTTTTTGANGSTTTTTTPATTTPPAVVQYAVGADAGNYALVRVYDNTGAKTSEIIAYPNFRGGVHATLGDVTGDGVADIVTGPGGGMKPIVKVFDGVSGQQVLNFEAYDPAFRGGVNVVVADMDNDGRNDIVVGAGDGGGSHVKIFNGAMLFPPEGGIGNGAIPPGPNAYIMKEFFAYDPSYLVGARIAVADVNGDGKRDIITAAGVNGGPHVRVFNGADGTIYREWMAYDVKFNGGVYVSAGDLNGDGKAEVITGMGVNGISQVRVFDGTSTKLLRQFTPAGAAVRVSSRVSVFDFDKDGDVDIVVGNVNQINAYDGKTFVRTGGLTPFDPTHIGGFFFS